MSVDPGPWQFGELLTMAAGKRRALREQAVLVWTVLGSEPEQKRTMVGPDDAARLLNMAFKN